MSRRVPVHHPDFGQAFPCDGCVDASEAARKRRRNFSGLPQKNVKTFDDFVVRSGAETALEVMRSFPTNETFLITLSGRNGTGKTHLMEALGHRLLDEDVMVRYVYVPDLLEELRSGYDDSSGFTAQMVYERHQAAEVLLLDDLPDRRVTEFAVDQMTRLVDERYRHQRPLVVSTNLTAETMGSHGLWGPRLADRLFDSWNPGVRVVHLNCASYRTGMKWPALGRR